MKIITHSDIESLGITPQKCYEWVEEAFKLKNERNVILPPKISMKPNTDGSFINVMPCLIDNHSNLLTSGVKVVTRYPNRAPALESKILLIDAQTGNFKALLDANFITAMRTGAVAAYTVKLLAKKNFNTIALMGLGNVLHAAILILLNLYPNYKLNIKLLKYKDHHEKFISRFSHYSNLSFECFDDYNSWAQGADVIISGATYLSENLCQDSSFDRGVLLVPIHTRGFCNCDLFFDKVFGDDKKHLEGFKYFNKFKYFAEISDVINGRMEGRTKDNERIIAYCIGIAMHDIFFATKIYDMLMTSTKVTEVDLDSPTNKLWI